MTITGDLTVDAARFSRKNISQDTAKTNAYLEDIGSKGPRWREVGIVKYRDVREVGVTPLPVPVYLPAARDATLPSKEAGRDIPV